MRIKKLTTIATVLIVTSSLMGCSQSTTDVASKTNTGSSQVAGAGSQVGKTLIKVAIGLAISAVISNAIKKKTEDTIEDTIRNTINNN